MAYGPVSYAPTRRRPRARGSLGVTLFGFVLIVIGAAGLPWFGADQLDLHDTSTFGGVTTSASAVGVGAFVLVQCLMLVPALLVALAGTLDSTVCRVLYSVLGVLWLIVLAIVEIAAGGVASANGYQLPTAGIGVSVIVGVVLLCWFVGYGFLRRLALRIVSGLLLLFAAGMYALTAAGLAGYSGVVAAGVGLAGFGYLLCAIGSFAGPRYEYH
ncbi:hypothetical protein Athai_37660 [Actinocatenispora thailandica]|uniref:Uncharacterized protein n=1 Tax=Actinocatenispora thailandica TaxID=227318 RepID=A0A7R7HYP1_9ACTN|nr:hypothetical protein [Actinocatenispora thailandica]BCJ36263.1 hypothetical protein Athai_37660 [Actinocatenispora thailandica]